MPILSNSKKALRRSKRKRVYNQRVKSRLKSALDAFNDSPSKKTLSAAFSAIGKAVKRNVWHKNKAARIKSRLSRHLNQAQG